MARATSNPAPFKLLGFEYSDYERWCEENGLPKSSKDSKKKFFSLALEYKIIKKNGAVISVEGGK